MESRNAVVAGVRPSTGHDMRNGLGSMTSIRNRVDFVCRDKDGNIKWTESVENLTTNVGLADMVSKYWKGSAYTAAWTVGLKNTGSPASTDTMASHASWTEFVTYSQGSRPTLTLGTVTGTTTASVDNVGNLATFSITGAGTIFGAFINSDGTKSGTSGVLVGVADFGASRVVANLDTLTVQWTITQS